MPSASPSGDVSPRESAEIAADPFHAFVALAADPGPVRHGPLAGLCFAAKDLLDVAGRAPGLGLARAGDGPPPTRDAAVIRRLREAGAVLAGFAQMTALAYEPSGANPVLGRPRNPWSAEHIAGGSSSGSAVAVAAGLVPLAIGSDTAGSLRIPAHCCGIAAWKPSFALVPTEGAMPLAESLDAIGFMAREAALLEKVAARFLPAGEPSPVAGIAVAADIAAGADPSIRRALDGFLAVARRLGLAVRETSARPLIAAADRPVLTLLQGEAARAHADRLASGRLDAALATRLAKGQAIGEAALADARASLAAIERDLLPVCFGAREILVLPVTLGPTPRVAVCEPESPEFSARALYALSELTRFVNGLGLPAVAVPAGFDGAGLPVGLQLVGRRGTDAALLRLARRYQEATDWHLRRPGEPAGAPAEEER